VGGYPGDWAAVRGTAAAARAPQIIALKNSCVRLYLQQSVPIGTYV